MENLQKLLSGLNEESNEKEIVDTFNELAKDLLSNYQIESVSGVKYDLLEIEFYFFNENHQDTSVHRHGLNPGTWRAHYSGLDITFNGAKKIKKETLKNNSINDVEKISYEICNKRCISCNEKCSYGGILIRSIRKGDDKQVINGPLRVLTTLFSGNKIDGNDNKGRVALIPIKRSGSINYKTTTRCGVINANGYHDNEYCYYNTDLTNWDKAYLNNQNNKERIKKDGIAN